MSPQPSLRERQTDLTKDAILGALVELVAEGGIDDFTMRDVARAAGVSPRTVYNCYPNRAALLEGLSDKVQRSFADVMGTPDGTLPEVEAEAMPALFERVLLRFAEHERELAAYVTLAIGSRLQPAQLDRSELMRRIFAKHTAHLSEDDAEAVVTLLRGIGSSTLWYHLRRLSSARPNALARTARWAVATLLRDLAAGADPRRRMRHE